ncbi:MAG: sigma-E factor negative regulatory protein [Gammaproteobacteria bacterium]|jgi:sigma-E factor negative regulatory protein RseA
MKEKLKEQISALLDNELSDTEADSVLTQLTQQQELRQEWDRYHLIGDVMRGEPVQLQAHEISGRVRQLMESEPAIISRPQRSKTSVWKSGWIKPAAGAALAASVATVAVITSPGFFGQGESMQPQLTATNISNEAPPLVPITSGNHWNNLKQPSMESRLNGYLVDHSEYASPGAGIGVMPYATFVGYDAKR